MSGSTSRTKGQSGEREAAALLSELTGLDVRRRVRQHDADSDLEGIAGWSVEVKRHRQATRASIRMWWLQALEQADRAGLLPLLLYRQDREGWRAVWPLCPLLTGQAADLWRSEQWTADTTPQAWAAVWRELTHFPKDTQTHD